MERYFIVINKSLGCFDKVLIDVGHRVDTKLKLYNELRPDDYEVVYETDVLEITEEQYRVYIKRDYIY